MRLMAHFLFLPTNLPAIIFGLGLRPRCLGNLFAEQVQEM
jgi:hypothetical protein